MRYLASKDILAIHEQMIAELGGASGVRESELLSSIAEKPQASFGGQDLYPDIYAKAASLYEALCNYHVFVDGNKRTAALALYRFLFINDFDLTSTNDELERYTLSLANGHPDLADVAAWVQANSQPLRK